MSNFIASSTKNTLLIMFFFREKMAFFTRTQMTVPFIPDDDNCPVEGTEGQTKTDGACDDKYVVSRSMGVEV